MTCSSMRPRRSVDELTDRVATADPVRQQRCPSADFVAQLSVEDEAGRWINVSDGNLRVALDERVQEIVIPLSATAFTVAPGRGLQLAIAGSSFPTLDRNPHTGASALHADGDEFTLATHVVFHDSDRPSRLELPMAGPGPGLADPQAAQR